MTTVGTITTVGRFTFDSATSTIEGPANYIRSDDYRQLISSIEGGTNHTFRAAMQHSPNFETALLVTIQTNYAGWAGMRSFNRAIHLTSPYDIGPRLMPSLRLADGSRLSIEASEITAENRVRWLCIVDDAAGREIHRDETMCSGVGDDPADVVSAFSSFASFVGAWVESLRYGSSDSENADLFPEALRDWADENADELYILTITEDEE